MTAAFRHALNSLAADDRGDSIPAMILLLAAVTIPLIIALGTFGEDIVGYLSQQVAKLKP